MIFKNYHKCFKVNKPISLIWDETREAVSAFNYSKVSYIDKTEKGIWYFSFIFSKRIYYRGSLAIINGKVYSKDDGFTTIDIESNLSIDAIFANIFLSILVFMAGGLKGSIAVFIIKVLLVVGFIIGTLYGYRNEAKLNINEYIKKLKLD